MKDKKFQVKLRASETYSFLRLKGLIDEDNTLALLIPKLTGDVLVVDASEVSRINSCGVRDWVNWVLAVDGKKLKVVLIKCPPPIVNQINMVTNFVGGAIVHSFEAPYYCPDCDVEVSKLIETESLLEERPVRAPSFRCSECGGPLDFDDIQESYFAFINEFETVTLDNRLKRLVDEVSPDLEAKIRALNETGSGPLSGPLHTLGTMPALEGGSDVAGTDASLVPPGYFDIDEEEHPPGDSEPARELTGEQLAIEAAAQARSSPTLLYAFFISALVVIGLLIYFAVTGV